MPDRALYEPRVAALEPRVAEALQLGPQPRVLLLQGPEVRRGVVRGPVVVVVVEVHLLHGRHDRVGHADEAPGHADEDDELGQLLVCAVQAVVQEQPEHLN